jgi:SAM-dependent methyltransferase
VTRFVIDFASTGKPAEADGRLDAPAFHRNHEPIWSALAPWLHAQTGDVLEVGSGTGQHIVEFARKAPHLVWWPSDCNEGHLKSIAAWRRFAKLANLRAPQRIDLSDPAWAPHGTQPPANNALAAIIGINVLHIAPWRVAEGLFAGAGRHLRAQGRLFIYGPFKKDGQHTAPSNADFDASLRAQDSAWGVRDMADLRALAGPAGLSFVEAVAMPANNFILIFRQSR